MCTRKGQTASVALLTPLTAALAIRPTGCSKIKNVDGQSCPPKWLRWQMRRKAAHLCSYFSSLTAVFSASSIISVNEF